MVRYPFFAVHFLFCHTFLSLRQKHKQTNITIQTILNTERQSSLYVQSFSDSPITFLVQVAAALRAVLLVALRLVQAVGGARPHLRILGKEAHAHGI